MKHLVFASLLLTVPLAQASPAPPVHAAPPAGPVAGILQGNLAVWQGIPYAQPPVGQRRWQPPQPLAPWAKERQATQPGAVCPQTLAATGHPGKVRGSEDCLFLNIYSPRKAQPLPVMVWLHGGSYETGAGSDLDPSTLAREQGVVVVTVNYRLGALGFLAAPGLEQAGDAGNYGLQDQQLALKWVRENIGAFGGNPRNVTVFGESAGGMSICQHLTMPGSRGLFDRAIIQSGPCTAGGITVSREQGLALGAATAKAVGCRPQDAACLRALPAQQLALTRPPKSGTVPFPPVYGVPSLPEPPGHVLGTRQAAAVPLLIGSNLDEGRAFAAYAARPDRDLTLGEYLGASVALNGNRALPALFRYTPSQYGSRLLALAAANTDQAFACPTNAIARARSHFVTVYSYEYRDRALPVRVAATPGLPSLGAFHSAELSSVLGTSVAPVNYAAFSPAQRQLAQIIRTYWANFAKAGNPNGAGLPTWPPLDPGGRGVQALSPQRSGPVGDFRRLHHCGEVWP